VKRSEGRFLTTHVGSIIRPPRLLQLAHDPTGDRGVYESELESDVAEVVRQQAAAGLDVVNDGEFGKVSWSNYILGRISGFEVRDEQLVPLDWLGSDRERFRGFFMESEISRAFTGSPAEVCVGPIEYVDRTLIDRDLKNLAAASEDPAVKAAGVELFFTSVAPASTAYQGVNEYYPSEEEYIFAIAEALREEYLAINEAGFVLQVDDAVMANMYDHLHGQGEGVWERWADLRVEALNHALRGIPPEAVRYHICYGSWHVPHVADAPLDAIVGHMLRVNAGAYSIEAANPRHDHEWTVWEEVVLPEDKVLIPGVITHHTTTVEHPLLVAQRIERFARILGPERIIAGSDCGFAQSEGIRRVHPEVMRAKYGALVEGAKIASERFFG
jgi:5-methyltetrahydropteroyltriglutamate--homocysteine methyltransferase